MRWVMVLALAGCGSGATGGDGGQDLASGGDLASTDLAGGFSFAEPFAGGDGAAWPSRWRVLGGVASSSIQGGRGRIVPVTSSYSLGRMGTTEGAEDVEVTFRVTFEDAATQGVGFYVRQNGGWLQGTTPHGQGYAVFVERFRGSRMGAWRELDGMEMELQPPFTGFATPLASNVEYAVRFRCAQMSPTVTHLQARLWDAAQSEPTTWQVDVTDNTAALQNLGGGMAIDSYSNATSGTLTKGTLVGNVVVTAAQ